MPELMDIKALKQQLAQRTDALVPELLPAARAEPDTWCCGDVDGTPGQSLRVWRRGARQGEWCDFATGAHGDLLDLVAQARGLPLAEACRIARDWLGLGNLPPAARARQAREAARLQEITRADQAAEAAKLRRYAQGIYLSARPIQPGDAAWRYFQGRAIDLAALPRLPASLRLHPALTHKETKARAEAAGRPVPTHQAIVACIVGELALPDRDGVPRWGQIAAHRTYLEQRQDGSVGKLAGVKDAKLSVAAYAGGLIALARGASGKPLKAAPPGDAILLTEGIENGLTAAQALPGLRVAAAVALANLGNLARVLPPAIGTVNLALDNDAGPGQRAQADRAVRAFLAAGRTVRIVRAPAGLKDWNDWAQALAKGEAA